MDSDKEDMPRQWSVKPAVLPDIPFALKKAWKANRVKLETAGVFDFLCWIQLVTKVAFVSHVVQFMDTYSIGKETAQVDGRVVPFSAVVIRNHLKLPADGILEGQLPAVTKKQHEVIFEGDYPKETKQWRIIKARQHWRPWLKFVNDYLIFRPHVETMDQKFVVAAIQTWEGKKINWALIVQKQIHAEIVRLRVGTPKLLELYSAFYISFLCSKMPSPVTKKDRPSVSQHISPLSSPGGSEELREDNHQLRLQLRRYKALLEEKSEQLLQKREALMGCQSTNLKYLQELSEAMKSKIEQQEILEESKKAIRQYQEQAEAHEQEKATFQRQLTGYSRNQEQLEECREEVQRVTGENSQLRERVQKQEEELVRLKAIVNCVDKSQPSATSTILNPLQTCSLTWEQLGEIWSLEAQGPVPQNLFQMYDLQSQYFFLVTGLKKFSWIDHTMFQLIWQQSTQWGVENLFSEILARRHVNLSDPYSAFITLGDLGARVFLYYASLENQWVLRHQTPLIAERREASWQDYGPVVLSQFYSQPIAHIGQWQEVLRFLLAQVQRPEFITEVVAMNLQRHALSASQDIFGSHYMYQADRVVTRLGRYLQEVASQKKPLLNLHGQVQFESPPANFRPPQQTIELPVTGSPLTLRFLGQYANMFDSPREEPIPTWSAIAWILEDYGQSRTEEMPADIYYRRISRQWPAEPPVNVSSHPHFCPCPRRGKWNPSATISSVEYNWPLITGPKATAEECKVTYRQFFQEHVSHCDPVCFRAAVFANVLSDWCGQWNVTIDVNCYHESHHEFLLLLKLQYRPTRWIRLVEAMALTHFIAGAHKCLINEFPYTRAGPFERFLRWQRTHAPELVAQDEDLFKAVEKMETRELKRAAEDAVQHNRPAPKLLKR